MIEKTNKNKPKNNKGHNSTISDVLCDIDTGYHSCFGTSFEGDLNKYGIGVSLYFKFIKSLAIHFLLFTVLTIPILIFTYKSNNYFI